MLMQGLHCLDLVEVQDQDWENLFVIINIFVSDFVYDHLFVPTRMIDTTCADHVTVYICVPAEGLQSRKMCQNNTTTLQFWLDKASWSHDLTHFNLYMFLKVLKCHSNEHKKTTFCSAALHALLS